MIRMTREPGTRNPARCHRVPHRLWPLACAILIAATAAAAPIRETDEGSEDGILTVYNPADPAGPARVLQPELQWRLGGADDPETLFGLVTDAQRAADGTTYLLDAVLSTVHEVADDGRVRRTLGREGDGPGEFRNALGLALLPDRGLGIVEMMSGRMVVLAPDGTPRPGVELGGGDGGRSHIQRVARSGDGLVMGLFSMRFNEGKAEIRHTLGTYGLDGVLRNKVLHTYEEQSGGSVSISSGQDNDFAGNWTVLPDGRIAVYRRTGEYLIEVFRPGGEPDRRIRRDYKSVRRPEADLAAQRETRERLRERFGADSDFQVEEMARDIIEVVARPDGRLWVLTSRGRQDCPAGCLGVFDVIEPDGRFSGQVRLEVDYSPDEDNFLIRGNHLYVLKEAQNAPDRTMTGGGGMMMIQMSSGSGDRDDEDEEARPYEVVCYRLPDGR